MLKGRFPSLRSMSGYDLTRIYTSIEALLVIHNILQEQGDDPSDIEGYNGTEDLGLFGPARDGNDEDAVLRARNIDNMIDTNLYRTGLYRRKQLLDFMEFEHNYM